MRCWTSDAHRSSAGPAVSDLVMSAVYGNAFSAQSVRCFRMIYEEVTTRPTHCPGEVQTRGWWRDNGDRWWTVDACREHAGELSDRRPGPGDRLGVSDPTGLTRRPPRGDRPRLLAA